MTGQCSELEIMSQIKCGKAVWQRVVKLTQIVVTCYALEKHNRNVGNSRGVGVKFGKAD